MLASLWFGAAIAGTVYLNEVPVPPQVLSSIELQQVDLRVEPNGDVHVTAPGYAWENGRLITPGSGARMVPRDGWWLVIEDQRSRGLTVEVRLNGQLVKQVSSGEPNRLVPIDGLVRGGRNEIRVDVVGGASSSGKLAVFAARGHTEGPMLVVDGAPTRWLVGADSIGRPLVVPFDTPR